MTMLAMYARTPLQYSEDFLAYAYFVRHKVDNHVAYHRAQKDG
jgi:hypothetical protein